MPKIENIVWSSYPPPPNLTPRASLWFKKRLHFSINPRNLSIFYRSFLNRRSPPPQPQRVDFRLFFTHKFHYPPPTNLTPWATVWTPSATWTILRLTCTTASWTVAIDGVTETTGMESSTSTANTGRWGVVPSGWSRPGGGGWNIYEKKLKINSVGWQHTRVDNHLCSPASHRGGGGVNGKIYGGKNNSVGWHFPSIIVYKWNWDQTWK